MPTTAIKYLSLLTALLALLLTGCASEGEPVVDDGEEVPMEIQIAVALAGSTGQQGGADRETRAVEPPLFELPDYPQETLKTLRVIIVDEKTGRVTHNRSVGFANGLPLEDDLRFSAVASRHYSVYLIGNEAATYFNYTAPSLAPGALYRAGTLENIILTRDPGYPLIDNTRASGKMYIPMAEKYSIKTRAAAGTPADDERFEFALTRAATKFAFTVNCSEDFTEGRGRRLTTIGISDIADKEYLFPRNAQYEPGKYNPSTNLYEGREIVKFDIPERTQTSQYVYRLPSPVEFPVTDYSYAPEIYLPESLRPADGFTCTLSFDDGESWLIPVTLPNLPYGLPRNTFVKINITMTDGNFAILDFKVMPWETQTVDFEYSDHVGLASGGALRFYGGKYDNLDMATARLVMRYPNMVYATFNIASPVGARWDAYLMTTKGTQDAFRFMQVSETATESYVTHISGMVGTPAYITFGPYAGAGKEINMAELVVTVTLPDGHTMPANILQGGGFGTNERLTIIQNPQ